MRYLPSVAGPLRAPAPRALLEGLAGCTFFVACGAAIGPFNSSSRLTPLDVCMVLAFGWLTGWTAWRLRRVPREGLGLEHWWVRVIAGLVRLALLGIAMGLAAIGITSLVFQAAGQMLTGFSGAEAASVCAVLGGVFAVARITVLAVAAVRRRVQRRLRLQLMVANIVVVILTIITMTGVGSLLAIQLILYGSRPDATAMAKSTASAIAFADSASPLDARSAQRVLDSIERRHTPIAGEPPLAGFVHAPLLPGRLLLVRPDGSVIAASDPEVAVGKAADPSPRSWFAGIMRTHPQVWRELLSSALKAGPDSFTFTFTGDTSGIDSGTVLAEAPLIVGHRTAGIVVAQVPTPLTAPRIWQGAIAIFGVSTVGLILVTAIPVLIISFFASYVLARGLTRRLEDVSSVATAIAAGDLSRRAPVNATNEIGRLAGDVNHMAAHLEVTMRELEKARTDAVEALASRRELVAAISHELRTPLAVLRAHLESLLLRQPVPASGPKEAPEVAVPAATLESLQHETERLASLVDDLFQLSRVEAEVLEVRHEPVDVAAVADEVVALMGPLARRDGSLTLKVEAEPGLPAARADPDRLHQILANLVRNAVRHTPDGGIIVLRVAREDAWIVLSVADTGEGIAAEHLPHVFEPFYRVDPSRTRDAGGAGLGLAIVAEFVQLMGGRITVDSQLGEGACFKVYLPVS